MPTISSTTNIAIFDTFQSINLSPSTIYSTFTGLINTAVDFGLWMIQVAWPFLLGIAFIYLMWGLARKFTGIGR